MITAGDQIRLAEAIRDAESRTAGEIVVVDVADPGSENPFTFTGTPRGSAPDTPPVEFDGIVDSLTERGEAQEYVTGPTQPGPPRGFSRGFVRSGPLRAPRRVGDLGPVCWLPHRTVAHGVDRHATALYASPTLSLVDTL